jgi:hypothetical protein
VDREGLSMSLHSYVVTSAAETTGHGTLRSAIRFANAHPGTTITFASRLAEFAAVRSPAAARPAVAVSTKG